MNACGSNGRSRNHEYSVMSESGSWLPEPSSVAGAPSGDVHSIGPVDGSTVATATGGWLLIEPAAAKLPEMSPRSRPPEIVKVRDGKSACSVTGLLLRIFMLTFE